MTQTDADLLLLFAGSCLLLVLASLVGMVLQSQLSPNTDNPTVETYLTRVRTWWVMVLLMTLALLTGRIGIVVLFLFCSFAALREFLTLTTKTKGDHMSLVAIFYVVLPAQYVMIWLGESGLFSILIPVYAFLLLPIVSVLRQPDQKFLARVSETQWALMICVYCLSHVPALLTLDIPGYQNRVVLLVAFLVLVVQLSDLMEYYVGRRFGRRSIAPRVSPKTWEGVGAGTLTAALIGFVLNWITPFAPHEAALMAIAIFLIGSGGSVVLAAIKRDLGVRDWGHLIPGQGGFVDKMDSAIFAAPVFYHLTAYFWSV
ncbi:phosphatidate cytidylyltransferase [Litoreibacter roseus]|uniref:Phosphatidate cytidylyltransferase n=1 Tax=Litoreibacter roseus TaxID=2601869 RepID=A0A6N6J9V0_9RHOB|nr:phosphatidate cytidylyltransferase [Litoreibacter roseus]GFE63033.1 phosphatidate cytidylyltransferase [Litoreibacter roseus]